MPIQPRKVHWTQARQEVTFLRRSPSILAQTFHFVGIGGCGMSALALMLHQRGHTVSGSDMNPSPAIDRLKLQGIPIHIGHSPDTLPAAFDALVISAAVKPDNPELQAARQKGVAIYKYAQLLGRLTDQIPTFAVAGTHGKSTTSGWLAYLIKNADRDPSFVIGADVCQLNASSAAGRDDLLVIEACEYDRSFLNFAPHAAAILNIEPDHLDYYADLDEIILAFADFARKIDPQGLLIHNGDDPKTQRAAKVASCRSETFSLDKHTDWRPARVEFDQGRPCFDLEYQGRSLGRVRLALPGRHNLANALAVAALANQADIPHDLILKSLESFTGVARRMTLKGNAGGVTILDDYAHHPTEIRVTLNAIRSRYQPKRLWCVFQPHQHSRTRFLLNEFALSFDDADVVLLPDIYFVRDSEQLKQTVNAQQLADKINRRGKDARFLGSFDNIMNTLCTQLRPGDLVVTMGAGNIGNLADDLVQRL